MEKYLHILVTRVVKDSRISYDLWCIGVSRGAIGCRRIKIYYSYEEIRLFLSYQCDFRI
jgi:hypothetical protein